MVAISGVTWIVIWALKREAGWWKSVKLGKLRENHRRLPRVGPLCSPSTLFYAGWNPPEGGKGRAAV